MLATRPPEELEQKINWVWLQTDDEYAVLAERHFDRFGDQVRRDLADGFQTFRHESIDRLREKLTRDLAASVTTEAAKDFGAQRAEQAEEMILSAVREHVETQIEGLIGEERYNRMSFAQAALRGIAANGSSDDAQLVRPWAEDDNRFVREAALVALARVGDAGDAERLADGAAATHGDESRRFTEAALQLDPSVAGPAKRLLSQREELAALAAWHLASRADEIDDDTLWSMLNHQADDVRRAGVASAAQRLDDDGLRSLLAEYLAQKRWFYNVVWLLDRLLYAPAWLRDRTRTDLAP